MLNGRFTLFKGVFARKGPTPDAVIRNMDCKSLLGKVLNDYGESMVGVTVIIETESGKKKETYFHCAGLEPAQAILNLDQLHHRIQHEGLPDYE